jgi:hypothetical protein
MPTAHHTVGSSGVQVSSQAVSCTSLYASNSTVSDATLELHDSIGVGDTSKDWVIPAGWAGTLIVGLSFADGLWAESDENLDIVFQLEAPQ